MSRGTASADALVASGCATALVAFALSSACEERAVSPTLLRPTPLTSTDWGPPPQGHHSLSGTVTEPDGQPVEGARVSTSYGGAVTDHAGRFRIDGVGPTAIGVRKEGFESGSAVYTRWELATTDVVVDLALARIVRLEAGATYRSTLYSKDLYHELGDPTEQPACAPCRLVRVEVPSKGVLTVHAAWAGSEELKLYLVTETHPFWPTITDASGRGSVTAAHESLGEEVLVYIGLPSYPRLQLAAPIPFTITTSFQ